jgi:4-carboxymuconolactone decarboxylase
MADAEKLLGVVPFILTVMRERADTFVLSAFADFKTKRPEHLTPKTAELIAIAAAAGAGADNCMKVHRSTAQKEGATRDEILGSGSLLGVDGYSPARQPRETGDKVLPAGKNKAGRRDLRKEKFPRGVRLEFEAFPGR